MDREDLIEARLVLHYAAQLLAAVGQTLLPAEPDDSQQSLSVREGAFHGALQTKLNPVPLVLHAADAQFPLAGRTMAEGLAFLSGRLGHELVLPAHPADFPVHALGSGGRFPTAGEESRAFLARLFFDTAVVLAAHPPLRLWPHHFDLACTAKPVSAGFSPGDGTQGAPYWYATISPTRPFAVGGGGRWHTEGWVGAELPLSQLAGGAKQLAEFFESAFAAGRGA